MEIEIISENLICAGIEEAITEIAFCHYPVTVNAAGNTVEFVRFEDAENYLLSLNK